MPHSPGTRCSDPTCGDMATSHGKCATHQRKPWDNPSQHTLQMDPTRKAQWRKQVIAKTNGRCVMCGAPAQEADHIVEIADGGALYDVSNGQVLCPPCHADKTRREQTARAVRKRALKATVRFK